MSLGVAGRAGLSHTTATAALRSLTDLGAVRARRSRRYDFFELNREHALVEELGGLFDREAGLRDELVAFLRGQLEAQQLPISEAYLYGSAARGDMGPRSDVDVALICPPDGVTAVEEEAFGRIAEATTRRFGVRLSPIVAAGELTVLRDPSREGHRLWDRVAGEGIPILSRRVEQVG